MDELVKMAYAMKKKAYSKGTIIFKQGERSEFIAIVKKGRISVVQKMTNHENKKGIVTLSNAKYVKTKSSSDLIVHIAELGAHDMFGIVELYRGFKKMKREALALTPVEVFLIQ
jgi:CRP-like cAMP-binding protein